MSGTAECLALLFRKYDIDRLDSGCPSWRDSQNIGQNCLASAVSLESQANVFVLKRRQQRIIKRKAVSLLVLRDGRRDDHRVSDAIGDCYSQSINRWQDFSLQISCRTVECDNGTKAVLCVVDQSAT